MTANQWAATLRLLINQASLTTPESVLCFYDFSPSTCSSWRQRNGLRLGPPGVNQRKSRWLWFSRGNHSPGQRGAGDVQSDKTLVCLPDFNYLCLLLVLCFLQIKKKTKNKQDGLSKFDYQAPCGSWWQLCNKRRDELIAELEWMIAAEEAISCSDGELGAPVSACSIFQAERWLFPRSEALPVVRSHMWPREALRKT